GRGASLGLTSSSQAGAPAKRVLAIQFFGIQATHRIRTDRVHDNISKLQPQPGGLEESSRGSSAATPPDADAKLICTPEGCQLNGITASYWRFFDAPESACIALGPIRLLIASKSSWNFAPTFSSASERSGSLY